MPLLGILNSFGQNQPNLAPPHPENKLAQRYEVDAKRMGVNINGEDALPRSREFKRIDSTYYVGWLFEGAYKYNHAADYLGFKNAIVPLERSLKLLERDYRNALSTRTANVLEYVPVYKLHIDYAINAQYLLNCYSNTEQPAKVIALMRRMLKWNFQRDYLDPYIYLAWTVHRYRFYGSDKYAFLKNTINDNEALAQRYLDSSLKRINRAKELNKTVFKPGYEKLDILNVYPYKAMLYSYSFVIDSAQYYYDLLKYAPLFPHNNYATFRTICGDFRTADKEYKKAINEEIWEKHLKEWAYYSSILEIYKAAPKTGIANMDDMIKASGSTPGFGWYNIALARCYLYDGNREEALKYIDKAAAFKELHIGTTLGQSHYDFSVQMLKLLEKEQAYQAQFFEHKNWWYNPKVMLDITNVKGEKYLQQFLIINQFAQNPERDRVIYKLFSTESTVSWDEVWTLISDFSTSYFLKKFQDQALKDNRKYVRKYFNYFVAKLLMKQGNFKEAALILNKILEGNETDVDYEKLFIARVYIAQAQCAAEQKDKSKQDDFLYKAYLLYPQLLPYTGMAVNLSLNCSGNVDTKIVDALKEYNINWVQGTTVPAANVNLIFSTTPKGKNLKYSVTDRNGNEIVITQSINYTHTEEVMKTLAYRLFNIGTKTNKAEAAPSGKAR
jgi:hypothetical protein